MFKYFVRSRTFCVTLCYERFLRLERSFFDVVNFCAPFVGDGYALSVSCFDGDHYGVFDGVDFVVVDAAEDLDEVGAFVAYFVDGGADFDFVFESDLCEEVGFIRGHEENLFVVVEFFSVDTFEVVGAADVEVGLLDAVVDVSESVEVVESFLNYGMFREEMVLEVDVILLRHGVIL